ncbi:MAG: beta strand repeat-containing protein [Gammaproteobacteria bacterium]
MATHTLSLVSGQSLQFDPNADLLLMDGGSAGAVTLAVSGTSLVLRLGAFNVTLLNTSREQLSSANVVFADGSRLLLGDDATGTTGDPVANVLIGTAGADLLVGMAGNDTLDGGDGGDTYLVTGTKDGTDAYRDSGATGVDRIVAGAKGAQIRLNTGFSAASSGIEDISANGYANVRVLGSAKADVLDFSAINLQGISLVDAGAGNDSVTGSAAADNLQGSAGNDLIDGGGGRDVAYFKGTRASYQIVRAGDSTTVQDLAPTVNGNDGTDTLRNIEVLKFLDGEVDLTQPTNAAPVAMPDTAVVTEDAGAVIAVLANDLDPDSGDTLRVVAVGGVGYQGSAQVAGGGTGVFYQPSAAHQGLRAGQTATEVLNYTIADAAGAQSSASLSVTVVGVNDAPVAHVDALTRVAGSGPVTIAVLANDTDVDVGDSRTVVSVDGSGTPGWMELILIYGVGVGVWHPGTPPVAGSIAIAPDGQGIVYDDQGAFIGLRAGQTATETIVYTMADGSGAQATAHAVVTIVGVNEAPAAQADSAVVARNASPVTLDVLANDTDPDSGDTRMITAVGTAGVRGSASIAAGGGAIIYAPGVAFADLAAGQTATEIFTYTMTDSTGAQSMATVTVTVLGGNAAPLAVADSASAPENGAALVIDVLANDTDADSGDSKTVVAVAGAGLAGTVAIAAGGGAVVYNIGSAYNGLRAGATATETFTYTMADSGGATSTAAVTVTVTGVNDNPVAVANSFVLGEDAGAVAIDVLANDLDPDAGDSRIVVATGGTPLRGTASVAADGSAVLYTPGAAAQSLRAGQSQTDSFTYTMRDGGGAQSTATVSVTITGANDAPVAHGDGIAITEDAHATAIQVLVNDTDPDAGDSKRVVAVDASGLRGSVMVAANGASVSYNPGAAFQHLVAGQSAIESFSYTMRDAFGAQSTAVVTVTINGVTDGPIAMADAAAADEDGGPIAFSVLANDANDLNPEAPMWVSTLDGDGIAPSIEMIIIYGVGVGWVNPGFPAVQGTISIAPDGHGVVYTPMQSLREGQVGTDVFKYTIADGSGRTSTAIATVSVTGRNDAPVAGSDYASVGADAASVSVDVLANDFDPDVGDSKSIVSLSAGGVLGSVTLAAGGAGLIYAPGAAFAGLAFGQSAVETFSYTMQDGSGAQSSATVAVTVQGQNHAPQAVADAAAAGEDGAAVVIDVLANDGDLDAPAGDTRIVAAVDASGLAGTVAIGAGGANVVYNVGGAFQSLRAGATATETFSYTIRDSGGLQSTANVTVAIAGVNDAPVAVANALSVSEDASPTAIAVLANDIDPDAGDSRTVVSLDTAGLAGSAYIAAGGGSVVYTVGAVFQALNAGQTATDVFTYTMVDGAGAMATAAVTITIIGANEPVVYVNPPAPQAGDIVGTAADDVISTGSGGNVVHGLGGDDEIDAGGGADVVYGGAGDDAIDGGDGSDVLSGGAGRDDLSGGSGADVFRYYLASESAPLDFDRIRDFNRDEGDRIDLSLIDANTLLGGNNDFSLVASFTGAGAELEQAAIDAGSVMVRADVNGDRVADFQIEVRTEGSMSALLVQTDFIV